MPVADRAAGAWNTLSGAVQALVVRDVAGSATIHRLLAPYLAVFGPAGPVPTSAQFRSVPADCRSAGRPEGRPAGRGGGVISVLVVDDSAVVRRVVADALSADLLIQVAGTASNGQIALEKIERLAPDLVTLDVEMPVMDGLATLRELRRRWPRLPVIMFSTMTEAGAAATLTAVLGPLGTLVFAAAPLSLTG